MTAEFDKDYLPAWCENCDKQGVYFVDDFNKPYHVIHKDCGYEIISAHCEDCAMGFALPNPPGERPQTWTCDGCGKEYNMKMSIFENPIDLYIDEDLPEEIRQQVLPRQNKFVTAFIFVAILAAIIVSAYLFR